MKKVELSLVPPSFRQAAAKAFMFGLSKYKRNSWYVGFKWTYWYDKINRHLDDWLEGSDIDEESGLNQLYHAAADLAALIEHVEKQLGEDDR